MEHVYYFTLLTVRPIIFLNSILMLKLIFLLLFTQNVFCDDDDDGFGWGFDDEDDDTQKEIDWNTVPVHNVIILGSGPAGSTAALYLARTGQNPLVLHGSVPGGQLVYTTVIENYPGFNGTGPELVKYMQKQAEEAGAHYQLEKIEEVNLSVYPYTLKSENNKGFKCKSLVIATGATARYLGIESEQRLRNRGVSACAVCDGALYRGQDVAVVGGGDAAIEEALYLSRICKSVKLIHRRDQFRASLPMRKKIQNSSVEIIWDTVVNEVIGEDFVTGLQLQNVKTGELSNINVNALFVAVGHHPATEPFKGQLEMDKDGYFVTKGTPATSKPGVFVAGDCADKVFRQAITSAGTGAQAALLAEKYLADHEN
ncbi:thioredoxin reductase [Tritrichomonas foetus]|uniref:Thioredoxin reductase n=1 Tax=Tritrichomonas foetus TaxID=1144522 RepID=A0A1J4J303_9EUKA|nr:thioredoxin reductase [Tritrichomonas foetus]|eukprot:OHS93121.1 thioredoxin reductase [Tritrichomonas foetus]